MTNCPCDAAGAGMFDGEALRGGIGVDVPLATQDEEDCAGEGCVVLGVPAFRRRRFADWPLRSGPAFGAGLRGAGPGEVVCGFRCGFRRARPAEVRGAGPGEVALATAAAAPPPRRRHGAMEPEIAPLISLVLNLNQRRTTRCPAAKQDRNDMAAQQGTNMAGSRDHTAT